MTPAHGSLANLSLGKQLPSGQFVLQGLILDPLLELKDLSLLGLDLFRIGLGIDPKALQLEPLLVQLLAKLCRILVEFFLLGLEFFPLFRGQV
jgi:hypothetical protein